MSFERPVGAAADAKELEYIAALIQTTDSDKEGFVDASIDARDIKYHLRSRYGINISKEQVRKIILAGFGGGDDEDDCLDICEVVAALLIPYLRKIVHDDAHIKGLYSILEHGAHLNRDLEITSSIVPTNKTAPNEEVGDSSESPVSQAESPESSDKDNEEEGKEKDGSASSNTEERNLFYEQVPPEQVLTDILKNILVQATGSSEPQPLTKELIRSIFAAYDETALVANDQLVSEMIAAAKNGDFAEDTEDGPILFDVETFARALTSDVLLYDPSIEDRITTNFVDVFGSNMKFNMRKRQSNIFNKSEKFQEDVDPQGIVRKGITTAKDDALDGIGEAVIAQTEYGPITKSFTFSILDFTIDNQRSRLQVASVWFGFISFFLRYLSVGVRGNHMSVCDGDGFGCKIAQSIFNWTVLMLLLCIIGVTYFSMLGSGNDVYRKSFLDILVGLAGVVVFFVFPHTFIFDAGVFSTDVQRGTWFHKFNVVVFIIVGSLIVICQILNALRLLFSDEYIGGSKILSRILGGTNTRDEYHFKRAAVFKVNRMMHNAYTLHQHDRSRTIGNVAREGTHDLALLNFNKIADKTESVGGFLWAWKRFFNGDLWKKEGIWLHTRILVGMFGQLLAVLITTIAASILFSDLIDLFPTEANNEPMCTASFDPGNCTAPEHNGTKVGVLACTGVTFEGGECNTYQLTDEVVINTTCEYITGGSNCDQAYAFEDSIYAMASGNDTQEDECLALLTTCVNNPNTETTSCVMGMYLTFFLPYRFEGPGCENIPLIDGILDSRPRLIEQFEQFYTSVDEAVEEMDSLTPKRWMVEFCAIVGLIVGATVGLSICIYYVPSTVSTFLKFRSGIIPSLRDPDFVRYRKSLEGVSYIVGLMVWGAVASAAVAVLIFAGAAFLLVWQVTRSIVINIIAVLIGIAATLTFKTLLITILGKVNYAAFYRKRPWIGNVAGVALECWHLGITTGYMLARSVKLIVAASMYIGRVDKPFMGDGVGIIGPVHLDLFPLIYRKGILSADAHRHPFIERLGLLYLLKIKHGQQFVTTAGSIWRLLFVFSLMPWLRKYRIADDTDLPEGLLMQKLGVNLDTKYEEIIRELKAENRMLRQKVIEQGQEEVKDEDS